MPSKTFFFFGSSTSGESPVVGPDGHTRITKLPHGVVGGGSKEEHERLQNVGSKIDQKFTAIYNKHGETPDRRFFEDAIKESIED